MDVDIKLIKEFIFNEFTELQISRNMHFVAIEEFSEQIKRHNEYLEKTNEKFLYLYNALEYLNKYHLDEVENDAV